MLYVCEFMDWLIYRTIWTIYTSNFSPVEYYCKKKKKKKMGEKEKVLVRVKIGLQRLSLSFSSKSGQYLLYKSASLDISLLHQLW